MKAIKNFWLAALLSSCWLGGSKPVQPTPMTKDERPEALSSYEESVAQNTWGIELRSSEARALFEAATGATGASLSRSFFVCRIELVNVDVMDLRGMPDPITKITLSGGRELNRRDNDLVGDYYVTAPLVDLQRGERVSIHIEDDDERANFGSANDLIADTSIDFDGSLPIFAEGDHAKIECRAITSREALEPFVAAALSAADKQIAQAYSFTSPPTQYDIDSRRQQLRGYVAYVAALVGWADPRVQRRVAKIDGEIEAHWATRLSP